VRVAISISLGPNHTRSGLGPRLLLLSDILGESCGAERFRYDGWGHELFTCLSCFWCQLSVMFLVIEILIRAAQ